MPETEVPSPTPAALASAPKRLFLSEGTSTVVYLEHGPEGRHVLKLLKSRDPSPHELARFNNEIELTQSLDVEGVRRAIRKDRVDGHHALVLEYVPGMPIGVNGVEDQAQLHGFLGVALRMTTVLGEVHARGIIHRDLKPESFIVDPDSQKVTLIGFGLASRVDLKRPLLGTPESLEGALPYMAPEQTGRMNRVVDQRSDLYALGACFFHMLVGRPPFEAEDAVALVHAHIARAPRDPRTLNAEIPPALANIVLKLLAKSADDRYQSAHGLKVDLECCLTALDHSGSAMAFPLGTDDISARFRLPQKLYGRDRELADLLSALHAVSAGGVGMVLVSGQPGVGKSALVHEAHKAIAEQHGNFIEGKCEQLQRGLPYYALKQAFRGLIELLLAEGGDRLPVWRARLTEIVGSLGSVLATIVPNLGLVVSELPDVQELSTEEAQNRLHYVARRFLRAVAGRDHPLVLFIDDLQWADANSLELLRYLLQDQENGHFLVVGTYRDNEIGPAHPLTVTLEKLRANKVPIDEISLRQPEQRGHRSPCARCVFVGRRTRPAVGGVGAPAHQGERFCRRPIPAQSARKRCPHLRSD